MSTPLFYNCLSPGRERSRQGPATVALVRKKSRHGEKRLTVDIHCHFTSRRADDLAFQHRKPHDEPTLGVLTDAERERHRRYIESLDERIRGTERRLREMDQQGIDIQVVSPGPMQFFYYLKPDLGREASRMVNDDIAELCGRHPDRLVPMGTVPMQAPRLAVEELIRCTRKLGMRAVEINTNVNGEELSEAKYEPFFSKAEELGVFLFMHPLGFTEGRRLARYTFNNVIGNPLESTIAVGHLIFGGVLDRHPGLKLCIAHGGGYAAHYLGRMDHAYRARPELRQSLRMKPSDYMKRLYYDTVLYDPVEVENLVRRWGARHVLLGTDWPYNMGEPDPLGLLKRCRISEKDSKAVSGLNAARLLGIRFKK